MTEVLPSAGALLGAPSPQAAPVLSVFSSMDGLARDEWDAFVLSCGASVHHTRDHCAAWWSHYGGGRDLHVLVFRAEGAIVAILPMFVERTWLGPVWIRRACLVGSDSTLAVLDPPVCRPWARAVFAVALRHLLAGAGCDAVRFAPLSGTWPHADALRDAVGDVPGAALARDTETGPHVEFELPATFGAFMASLDKRRRGDHRRGRKALEEAHELRTDVIEDAPGLLREFPHFVRLHDTQWAAEGRLGHFRDWPRSERYHADLLRAHGAAGRAHLVRILLDGETVSTQLCYSFGDVLHWVLPARSLRPELARHSLGRFGLVEMVEFAIRRGFRRIEAGMGHYDYKLQFGGREHQVRSFVVVGTGASARARLAVFARLATALDAAYYRGWFRRIAPRLPLRRRPLWKTWIRSRP